MPCHTGYSGLAKAVVVPFKRTELTIDQIMSDEFGTVHGTIFTSNLAFGDIEDYLIEAQLLELGGEVVFMTQKFLYLEKDGDAELCAANGWIGVEQVEGLSIEESMADAAQTWMTDNYQEFVHTHESPQDNFIVEMN